MQRALGRAVGVLLVVAAAWTLAHGVAVSQAAGQWPGASLAR